MKKILGITGGIGAGKSTVLDYLAKTYGASVVKCDELAASLQKQGGSCYEPMLQLFGREVLLEDGEFDRNKIAQLVFADPVLLDNLNRIVHPKVKECVAGLAADYTGDLLVIEAALLIEGGYDRICDEIWYIYADTQVRIGRLIRDRGYSEEKARRIIRSQQPDAFFRSRTQLTIDNTRDSLEDTYRQIDEGLKTHGFLHNCQRQQR